MMNQSVRDQIRRLPIFIAVVGPAYLRSDRREHLLYAAALRKTIFLLVDEAVRDRAELEALRLATDDCRRWEFFFQTTEQLDELLHRAKEIANGTCHERIG